MDEVVQKPNKGLSTVTAKLRDKVLTEHAKVYIVALLALTEIEYHDNL